jgi:hypothetical protein
VLKYTWEDWGNYFAFQENCEIPYSFFNWENCHLQDVLFEVLHESNLVDLKKGKFIIIVKTHRTYPKNEDTLGKKTVC